MLVDELFNPFKSIHSPYVYTVQKYLMNSASQIKTDSAILLSTVNVVGPRVVYVYRPLRRKQKQTCFIKYVKHIAHTANES